MNHAYRCWVESVAPWDVMHVMWHTRTNFLEELAYLSTKLRGRTWHNSIMLIPTYIKPHKLFHSQSVYFNQLFLV